MAGSLLFVIGMYCLMLVAFFLPKIRWLHIPIMSANMLIDFLFPIYLVLTKDWYKRLIEQGEILSFMIWMHFILVLTLYALYILQIMTARRLLKGDMDCRAEHRSQGIGILIAKGLVILSATMLIEPPDQG